MLKGIPPIIPPELLKVLCEMGHGDRIVIADGNFPSASIAKNSILIRMDGHNACPILDAVLQLFPLDTLTDKSAFVMAVTPGDNVETPIWDEYAALIRKYDDRGGNTVAQLERQEFYDAARNAYAVIATGEGALYANIMLQKGCV